MIIVVLIIALICQVADYPWLLYYYHLGVCGCGSGVSRKFFKGGVVDETKISSHV
jgi:hypothetical protein